MSTLEKIGEREDALHRFERLPEREREDLRQYNYEHFRTVQLAKDARRTVTTTGIRPGELAPDWELPCAAGGTLRLSDLRGRPVLLHIGSFT